MPKLIKSIQKPTIKPPQVPKNAPLILATLAVLLSCASLALSTTTYIYRPTKTLDTTNSANTNITFTETSVTNVAKQVSPSVVSILTETTERGWFGSTSISNGAGTGFIVSENGYIVTNKHVVQGTNKVSVVLADHTVYENVRVVDIDPSNDLAFLKIDQVDNLPAAKLGDSKSITIGQPVIAIGNALGEFQNTITSGIISGTGRSITASDATRSTTENLTDMLQTDASINPGNSGGPLVNAAGEVIGINTAVSAGSQGIGFAIPISSTKGIISQLVKTGQAQRAYLGVYFMNINANVAKQYNLPTKSGAYIYTTDKYSAIIKDSAADKAGVKDKDILTAINGTPVGAKGSVASLIGEYSVGDQIDLNLIRDGKEISLKVTLEAHPKSL